MNGSFIRTGDGDHKMSLYEIDRFIENQHRSARNDASIIRDAAIGDLDAGLLSGWLSRVRQTTLGRSGESNEGLMANRRAVATDEEGVLRPTLAGIMALGKYPQKFFPCLSVVFTSYPTPRKGGVGSGGSRFADTLNVDGPIPAMVVDAVRAVSRNMKHGAIVKGALREDVPYTDYDGREGRVVENRGSGYPTITQEGEPMRSIIYAGQDFSELCTAEVVGRSENPLIAEALEVPGRAGAMLVSSFLPPADVTVRLFLDVGFKADVNALADARHRLSFWLYAFGGGEVTPIITVSGGRVATRAIRLDDERGSWNGLRFTYGKNMAGCTRTVLEQDVYTALYGYGAGLPYTDEDGNYVAGYRASSHSGR